ncbi:unnamed protein product [Closterium sp. NIES-53]
MIRSLGGEFERPCFQLPFRGDIPAPYSPRAHHHTGAEDVADHCAGRLPPSPCSLEPSPRSHIRRAHEPVLRRVAEEAARSPPSGGISSLVNRAAARCIQTGSPFDEYDAAATERAELVLLLTPRGAAALPAAAAAAAAAAVATATVAEEGAATARTAVLVAIVTAKNIDRRVVTCRQEAFVTRG